LALSGRSSLVAAVVATIFAAPVALAHRSPRVPHGAGVRASTAASARPPLIDRSDPCGCDPVLVGWGHSRGGQEWVLRYGVRKQGRFLTLSLPAANGEDNGAEASWNDDALSRFVFRAGFGRGFAPPDPLEVDGAATAEVRTIRWVFSDRPPLVVHPYMASSRLRHRFPFLRHIRFYVAFYSGVEGTLKTTTAYDAAGRKLKTRRAARRSLAT
jgi:hypothetical protein